MESSCPFERLTSACLDALSGMPTAESTKRLELVLGVLEAAEGVGKGCIGSFGMRPENDPLATILRRTRQQIENLRVENHHTLSTVVLSSTRGLTEDGIYFLCVAVCDYLSSSVFEASCPCESHFVRPIQGLHVTAAVGVSKPVARYTPVDVDTAYAALFVHRRNVDWGCELVRQYLCALQWKAELTLAGWMLSHSQPAEFDTCRVEWACASARFKLAVQSTLWARRAAGALAITSHIQPSSAEDEESASDKDESGLDSGSDEVQQQQAGKLSGQDVLQWARQTVKLWNGPRLREAIAAAVKKRDTRPSENGRCVAFRGNSALRRDRAAMDNAENAVHSICFVEALALDVCHISGACEVIMELLLLKLYENVLEAHGIEFMLNHVFLDSMRDCWHRRTFGGVSKGDDTIIELYGGWVHRDANGRHSAVMKLWDILALWYTSKFPCADPVGLCLTRS